MHSKIRLFGEIGKNLESLASTLKMKIGNPIFHPKLAEVFVLYCASANVACWTTSLLGCLANPLAVWILLFCFGGLLGAATSDDTYSSGFLRFWKAKRCARILPASFLVIWLLAAIGALTYHPNNYDHLTYRFPRLLHYWSESSWHWIGSGTSRLNYSGIGYEWSWFPFFVLFKSDFGAPLLNLLGFALMPGETFRFLRNARVTSRIANIWMWVLPGGYGFVVQAGSAGNDLFGAILFLVAANRAFAFGRSRKTEDLGVAILATALLTATKLSNLPLILVVVVAAFASGGTGIIRSACHLRLLGISLVSLGCSALPIIIANIHFTGSWDGDPNNLEKLHISNPMAGFAGNVALFVASMAGPPVNPAAGAWNSTYEKLTSENWVEWIHSGFPRWNLRVRELLGEEDAGLGIGVLACLLITLFHARWHSRRYWMATGPWQIVLVASILFAFAVFLAKMGSENSPRIALPYYPAVIAVLLMIVGKVRRERLLAVCGSFSVLSGSLILVFGPSRPLWPWKILSSTFSEHSSLCQRLETVYQTYSKRWHAFEPIVERIPLGVALWTFRVGDNPEASLWRPIGSRKVKALDRDMVSVRPGDMVVMPLDSETKFEELCADAKVSPKRLDSLQIITKASEGPRGWIIYEFPKGKSLGNSYEAQ